MEDAPGTAAPAVDTSDDGGTAGGEVPSASESGPETASRPAILVSACLLGAACTHRGESKTTEAVVRLGEESRLIPVCPEVAGGLATPRPAAEIVEDGSVRTADGTDVTAFYRRGAEHAVALARTALVTRAVLKARSPSCGCHEVYDGTHSGRLIEGRGITATALAEAGFEVVSEEDLEQVTR
jgi:uncharacterized protein YbbK (DUF523 family)